MQRNKSLTGEKIMIKVTGNSNHIDSYAKEQTVVIGL